MISLSPNQELVILRNAYHDSRLSADLHSPGSADNEDDGGVAQHSHKGDGAIEYGEQHNDASLKIEETFYV